ncbi:putative MFS family arabinose efflux permease [Paeniglutamicibacter sulfureus]|uniref:MFS family arabinose efflux permease n=2 Tax=Paeniglutamicibacter sulfureus TaxID=43666 RepID=A0ABU2BMR6_9MICC|nr:MFS transporter [Paeniglutamicibacter sulfureus]MDR7358639.1 putative MFS family arabinose efflux permease [Paeniglutamicibacter sulfureus]
MSSVPEDSAHWHGHAHGSRGYRKMILALFAAGVATFSQLYSVQGVLPELARDLSVSEADAALAVSAATLGLAASVLFWSLLADRMGRLRAMTIAVTAAVALGLAVPFSPGFEWLLALRFIEGLALGGIPAVALAYLSEEVSPLHSAVAAGTYISGTTLGGLAGRLVAGPLSEFVSWRLGTLVVSVMAAVAAGVFIAVAPKPRGFTPVPWRSPNRIPLWKKLWMNLRKGPLLVLYAQGFLLMGGFVAVYNYLGFRLEAAPFLIPASLASLVFVAYLSGAWSSRQSGAMVARFNRLPVLLTSIALMAAGLVVTLVDFLPTVVFGLLVFTAGFFAAHSVASGWIPMLGVGGRAQAASLYNLAYYSGSSLFGWAIGMAFNAANWPGLVVSVVSLLVLAALLALGGLRRHP